MRRPVAKGSNVPVWPTLTLWPNSSLSLLRTLATTPKLEMPAGLSIRIILSSMPLLYIIGEGWWLAGFALDNITCGRWNCTNGYVYIERSYNMRINKLLLASLSLTRFTVLSGAVLSSTTWSVTIPRTNGNGISNTASRLYGQTTSKYATPLSGRSFTLAQP